MAKQSVVSLTKDVDAGTVTVTVTGHEPLVVSVADMAPFPWPPRTPMARLLAQAAMHGIGQKLVDAAAMSRNPDNGQPASVADKYAAVKAVYDRLMAGEWNAPRGEGGGAGSLLFRALCALKPDADPAALRAWLDGKSKKEQAALRASPRIAAEIERLRPAAGNADELLGELDGIDGEGA